SCWLSAPNASANMAWKTMYGRCWVISKLRNVGEPAPLLMPAPLPPGLSPEIGLLYGGVTMELQDCLYKWDTS
ncbi:MAG: hypothetical protein AAFV54_13635, partial [Pseudomonadota bacterium]